MPLICADDAPRKQEGAMVEAPFSQKEGAVSGGMTAAHRRR